MTGKQTRPNHDLFISYAEADGAWVEGYLMDALSQADIRVHSEAAFQLGVPRLLEFERAVQQSARTLLVLSPAYLAEGFTGFADLLAQSFGMETGTWPVIPLILRPVKLPTRLAMLTALDATAPDDWESVVARLCADLERPTLHPSARPSCPYPGMVPFSEADSGRFFGRDEEVRELLERLRLHPFLTVIGPSGSGKSSLVFAGLVPALRESGLFGPGAWLVRTMRPGEARFATPWDALAAALNGDPAHPGRAVADLLADAPGARRLLLVVDQFEELFRSDIEESADFQEALQHLMQVPDCYVILTVRADFYADLMATSLWPQVQGHRLEVLPLDAHSLHDAIVRPAEDGKVFVEAALVERLVTDAADEPGILPLVQETMVLLWENVERRFLPLRAYETLVLPRQAYGETPRTGLQVAMARRADAALAALTPAQQIIARRVFLRLVQFGEGRADTRRQQRPAALHSAGDDLIDFERTLHHLADHRLLTLSGEETADRHVDIAHEALITSWPTLQRWLNERRDAEQTRRRLEAKAAEWERLGSGSSGLLDEVELAEAERWLEGPDAADLGYGPALPVLVDASRRIIEEAERAREAARQRELAQARALAEAERRRAEVQAQASKRLRILAGGLAVVFVLAVAAALFARAQRTQAQQEARRSLSGQLAAQAQSLSEAYPQRGLLLALEALNVTANAGEPRILAAEQALRDALGRAGGIPLHGHGGTVLSAAFSHDGRWLATTGRDATIRLWDASADPPTNEALHVLRGHNDDVMTLAFGPEDRWLATGSTDGTLWLWDVAPLLQGDVAEPADLAPPRIIRGHEKTVGAVAISPDGRWLASGGWDSQVLLWDLPAITDSAPTDSGLPEPAYALPGHQGRVGALAFDPEGRWFVTAGEDRTVRLWDMSPLSGSEGSGTGAPTVIHVLYSHAASVSSVTFSRDGQWLASGSDDTTARVWRLSDILDVNPSDPSPVDFLLLRGHLARVTSVAFDRDGRWLATGSDDGTARLWNLQATDPSSEPRILYGHEGPVPTVASSPDGAWLATGSGDHTARLWDISMLISTNPTADHPTTEPLVLRGYGADVWAVAYSPQSRWLATAVDDGTARLWNVETGTMARLSGHTGRMSSLTFSPDERWLITGGLDGALAGWRLADLSGTGGSNAAPSVQPAVVQPQGAGVTAVTFNEDGSWLATGGDDNVIRLWEASALLGTDTASGGATDANPARTLEGHTARITDVAFSPDGRWLASTSRDGTVRFWDVANPGSGSDAMHPAAPVLQHDGQPMAAVTFSADGEWLATGGGGWDTTVRLWDTASFLPPEPSDEAPDAALILRGHTSSITSLSFAPDEHRLMSGSLDGTVRAWELTATLDPSRSTGDAAIDPLILQGHGDGVMSVAFSPDGRWMATGGLDHTVRVWRRSLDTLRGVACRLVGRNLTEAEWTQYFRDRPYRRTCDPWPLDAGADSARLP